MTSPTERRERAAAVTANRLPFQPPPPPRPFPVPVQQSGRPIPADPFAQPPVAGPSGLQPAADAGPSHVGHDSDQPPDPSPREAVAAIRAQLPQMISSGRRGRHQAAPLAVPSGRQGVAGLRAQAVALSLPQQSAPARVLPQNLREQSVAQLRALADAVHVIQLHPASQRAQK